MSFIQTENQLLVNRSDALEASASFLAELSVRSKNIYFMIYKNIFWIVVLKKNF